MDKGIDRFVSESHLHYVLLGLELSLYLPARSHDVVFRWRRLLHSIFRAGPVYVGFFSLV